MASRAAKDPTGDGGGGTASRDAAAAALARRAEAVPLVPHRCAASRAGRREGLVVVDDDPCGVCADATGISTGTGTGIGRWTERDTALALEGCPREEYLGLEFYLEDPLPHILRACAASGKMFVDHEFPTFPGASTVAGGPLPPLRPGIIAPSNRDDFEREGGKRQRRIPHFVSKAGGEWEWVRASSMGDGDGDRRIFSSPDSVDPRNVLQGRVGNCGFCSGFASLAAEWPGMFRDAFGRHSEGCLRACGAYGLRLYPRGRRRFLLLDDYLISSRGDPSCSSPSLHSLDDRDLWIRLLEKAYVKVQGSYASLDGHYKWNSLYRHPARAMQLLANAPLAFEVRFGRDVDEAYRALLATQGACARVAHCRKKIDGLHSNHGYSLLWVGEAAPAGGSRLVCLRNPHGRGSYTGRDWGVGSSKWQKKEGVAASRLLEESACFERCASTGRVTWRRGRHSRVLDADDGIFFMEFKKFVECFPIATIVGPIRPDRDDESGANKEDGVTVNVPDCVYRLKGKDVSCIKEVMAIALRPS